MENNSDADFKKSGFTWNLEICNSYLTNENLPMESNVTRFREIILY